MDKKRDVIIACDFNSKAETLEFLDRFIENKPYIKIGMELFYSEGIEIVKEIKKRGHKIFLDLKLHDIPNTVYKTMVVLGSLGVDMTNVHGAGGIEMMKRAKEGLLLGSKKYGIKDEPLLIGVTQLTSTDEKTLKKEILIDKTMEDTVLEYAKNIKEASLDGVVCSPLESEIIHKTCGDDFVTVTPGVRLENNNKGDQKRVVTPIEAKKLGSDYIVVGRPITQAEDPVLSYEKFVEDFVC